MRIEIDLERAEAAHDVLRRVGAIYAENPLLDSLPRELPAFLENLGADGELVELRRVHRDRRRSRDDAPPVVAERVAGPVGRRADDVLRGAHEVAPPATCVKTNDVVCQQAVVNS